MFVFACVRNHGLINDLNLKLICSNKHIKSKKSDDERTRDEIEETVNDEPVEAIIETIIEEEIKPVVKAKTKAKAKPKTKITKEPVEPIEPIKEEEVPAVEKRNPKEL